MNNINIIGNLVKKPELTEVGKDNIKVCHFNVAVNRKIADKAGNRECDYFSVVAWRTVAENCQKYLDKGKKVAVSGEMQMRRYEDKNGNDRTAWELLASSVEFLTPPDKTQQGANAGEKQPYEPQQTEFETQEEELRPITDSELPF